MSSMPADHDSTTVLPERGGPPAADGAAGFRRATRDDAVELARARFLAGERVEMQTLAGDLDIGRTTLYRWVGEREQLLEEVFAGLVVEWFAEVVPQATGKGKAHLLDVMRRFLEFAAAFDPLSEFASREPALTMRLLLDRDGMIAERSKQAIGGLLDEDVPDLEVPENMIDAIEMSAAALVWANIAIGREPDIEGAIGLSETLLDACPQRN
jgi:AcrR family transcriptional regulator